MIYVLFAGIWIFCGILAAGYLYAMFRKASKDRGYNAEDFKFSLILGLAGGPLAMVIAFIYTGGGKDGWFNLRDSD